MNSKKMQDAVNEALSMVKGAFALLKQAEDRLTELQAQAASDNEPPKPQPREPRREQSQRRPDLRPAAAKPASQPAPQKRERPRLDSTPTYFTDMVGRFIEQGRNDGQEEAAATINAGARALEIMLRDEALYTPETVAKFKEELHANAREAYLMKNNDGDERRAECDAQDWLERREAIVRKDLADKQSRNQRRSEPPPASKSQPTVETKPEAKPADDNTSADEPKAEAKTEDSDKRGTGWTAGLSSLAGYRPTRREREEADRLERIQA